jgi:transcriptional regulator with XRE-family HTH domain
MNGIRKNIWKYLKDRVFRQSYVEEHVRAGVAHQIKAMRESRGWSQAQLAEKCGKSQSNIARIEDPDYGKFSIQTLLEIAHSFDVWLSLEFVSFSKGLTRTADRSVKALNAISFEDEQSQSVYFSQALRTSSNVRGPSIFDGEFLQPQTPMFGNNLSASVSAAAQTGKLSAGVKQVQKQVQNDMASICN